MRKGRDALIRVAAAALCLFLTACSASYMSVSGGVATVDLDKALGRRPPTFENLRAIHGEVSEKLLAGSEPVRDLVLTGPEAFALTGKLKPVAETLQALTVPSLLSLRYADIRPASFTGLEVLRIGALTFDDKTTDEKMVEPLLAFPKLRELVLRPPTGAANVPDTGSGAYGARLYSFSETLKKSEAVETVNGQPLGAWDPVLDLTSAADKFGFTAGMLPALIEAECRAYALSPEPPPPVTGKIFVASQTDGGELVFKARADKLAFPEEHFARTLQECQAIIVVSIAHSVAGQYTDGSKGYRSAFAFEVFDPQNRLRYAPVALKTAEPPLSKSGAGEWKPDAFDAREIIELLSAGK